VKHAVADIETNGLLDATTVVHCLVIRDLDTNEVMSCTDAAPGYPSIREGLEVLRRAERVYFHNGIKFDIPALQKIHGFTLPRERLRDTLVIAQMRWAHIRDEDYSKKKLPAQLCGSHSLEAWGHRLGVHKGEYTHWCRENGIEDPWSQWSPEMQVYCEGDTATTRALVQHIRKWGVSMEAVEIEQELAWYLSAQEAAGVPFDMEKAQALHAQLAGRREEIGQQLREEFGPRYKKDGQVFTPKKDIKARGVYGGCPYQKLKLHDFNPGSRPDIVYHLTARFGWKPTEFTDSGQPELNDKTLKSLNASIPAVALLLEYLMIDKRLGQLAEGKEAWLNHATKDGRLGGKITGMYHIHGRVKQNHAITHRASHASPNLAQVPKVGSPFGAECRELFLVPKGWVMVGADASGLEARCLAHYMARFDGGEYGKLMLEGDVHTANQIALGLPEGKAHRNSAKTWFYAFMYGAGDEKLGTIVQPNAKQAARKKLGGQLKKQFLDRTPALKALIEMVQGKGKEQGYLTLIDGRRTYIRSDHAALNTLLQSAGAIICKAWLVRCYRRFLAEFGEPGWNGLWVPLLWVHDEGQWAVRPEIQDRFMEILLEEIRALTQHFKWRVPLDGEAKAGSNWKDTH
jgi:DNA polymerase I